MSKTSQIRTDGIRGSAEYKSTQQAAYERTKRLVDEEARKRAAADDALIVQARNAAVDAATSVISEEKQARIAADSVLQADINTLNTDVDAVAQAITNETVARQQADNAINQSINDVRTTEATARGQAVTALQNNLNAEATARQQADSIINNVVDRQINLSELNDGSGRYISRDIPLSKLARLINNTNTTLEEFQDADDYVTSLSEAIPAGESRLIVKITESRGGAEPTNGYIYVLNDGGLIAEKIARQQDYRALYNQINTEAQARMTADNTINQRINDIALEKSLTFTSRTLPAPYVVAPQQSDSTAIDIDLSGLFTINGRSCGTMNTVTVDTSCAPNTKHIIVAFDINTENITVTSSDSTVTANITNGVWKFSLANYLVPVYYNDDDPDDPDYGKYVIRGAVYNWDIPTTQGHGYITAEYNPITELRNIITGELGTLSTSLDAVNGG